MQRCHRHQRRLHMLGSGEHCRFRRALAALSSMGSATYFGWEIDAATIIDDMAYTALMIAAFWLFTLSTRQRISAGYSVACCAALCFAILYISPVNEDILPKRRASFLCIYSLISEGIFSLSCQNLVLSLTASNHAYVLIFKLTISNMAIERGGTDFFSAGWSWLLFDGNFILKWLVDAHFRLRKRLKLPTTRNTSLNRLVALMRMMTNAERLSRISCA